MIKSRADEIDNCKKFILWEISVTLKNSERMFLKLYEVTQTFAEERRVDFDKTDTSCDGNDIAKITDF